MPGNYVVKSLVGGKLYPFPINLTTLEQFFGRPLDGEAAACLLEEKRLAIHPPANSEEYVLSRVGRELYEAFYLNYTLKQWQMHPRELRQVFVAAFPCGSTAMTATFSIATKSCPGPASPPCLPGC